GRLGAQAVRALRAVDAVGMRVTLLTVGLRGLVAMEFALLALEQSALGRWELIQQVRPLLREPIPATLHAAMLADGSLFQTATGKAIDAMCMQALAPTLGEIGAKPAGPPRAWALPATDGDTAGWMGYSSLCLGGF